MPKVPFSTYSQTRLNADIQRRVNVYPNAQRGFRQFPGITSVTDITASSAVVSTYNPIAQLGGADGEIVWVSPDGLLMYIVPSLDDSRIYQYELATAFKASTATYTSKFYDWSSLSGPANKVKALDFSPDGANMFVAIDSTIYHLSLSSAYDISTASSTANKAVSEIASDITGIQWVNGDEVWICYDTVVARLVLSAGTDYTLATRTYTFTASSSLTGVAQIRGFSLNAAGTLLRARDYADDIYLFTMATPFSPNTLVSYTSLGLALNGYHGAQYRDGDRRFYVIDASGGNTVTEYSTGATGRGMITMGGVLYIVIGSTLYSVDRYGTETSIGTIANDPNIVGMATDGTRLAIAAGSSKYAYSVTGGLVAITDTDLQDAYTVAYLDQRFYYDQPNGEFVASEQNDPSQVDGLDFATAESFDDELLAVFVHNQLLYLCGPTTIEVWYSSGTGRPPVERQQVLQRGLAGRRAINSNDNIIYFLDADKRPNKMSTLEYQPIYTPALGEEFDSYATVSDCIVNCYTWQQERFAEFSFPTADATWVYHENSGQWSKRETDGGRLRIAFYAEAYNKLFGLGHVDNKIFELSTTRYQDNNTTYTRTLDSDLITSELYEVNGEDMIASCLNLTVFAELGSTTISVSFCTNPGADSPTFSTARSYTLSQGINNCRFYRWGVFREGVFRITTTANDRIEIIDADLIVEALNG